MYIYTCIHTSVGCKYTHKHVRAYPAWPALFLPHSRNLLRGSTETGQLAQTLVGTKPNGYSASWVLSLMGTKLNAY